MPLKRSIHLATCLACLNLACTGRNTCPTQSCDTKREQAYGNQRSSRPVSGDCRTSDILIEACWSSSTWTSRSWRMELSESGTGILRICDAEGTSVELQVSGEQMRQVKRLLEDIMSLSHEDQYGYRVSGGIRLILTIHGADRKVIVVDYLGYPAQWYAEPDQKSLKESLRGVIPVLRLWILLRDTFGHHDVAGNVEWIEEILDQIDAFMRDGA